MKTILILTPVWGRPEILKIFLQGFVRLRNIYPKLMLLCIVSPEDKYRDCLIDMIEDTGGEVCEYSNKWIGAKQNHGIAFALSEFKFKYLMQMGSDNLANPEIFKLYEPYMESKEKVFGINNIYCYEYLTGKCVFLRDYNDNYPLGVGRMYFYETLLEVLNVHKKQLWPPMLNDSLDCMSAERLRSCGIRPITIDIKEIPYVLDIKTNMNINHFLMIQNFKEKDIDFNSISKYFGINVYDEWILKLNTHEGFFQYVENFKNIGMPNIKAYEETEKVYRMYFGDKKYKNYEAYRSSKRYHSL